MKTKVVNGINNRYVIINEETGEIIDDAQGYGYKTYQKAIKADWYKYNNGREKIDKIKKESLNFFKENEKIKEYLNDFMEINFKEILSNEITDDDIVNHINEKYNVIINKKYFKYLK